MSIIGNHDQTQNGATPGGTRSINPRVVTVLSGSELKLFYSIIAPGKTSGRPTSNVERKP